VEIPFDAQVIDASKKVVMPGYVEAHSFRGTDSPNETIQSVPFVSTFDSIAPANPYFEDSLRQGITTIFVAPGNWTLIGGQGCIVRPTGITTEKMTVVKNHAIKLSLQPPQGVSRMAHLASLRKEFDDMLEYLRDLEDQKQVKTATGPAAKSPEIEVKKETMARLLQGKTTGLVYCPTAADVLKAIELSKQYKFKMKLVLGRDTWKAAADIAKEKIDVVLPADCVFWEADEESHEETLRVLPAIFAKAGVTYSFQTDNGNLGSSYLWYQAATAVKYGLSRAEALKAATLNPAKLLGMEDRFGAIEKGRDGNLLILTGDPLDAQTWVDQVIVEGRVVYEREKDAKLQRVLDAKK
jgi:imidazolonepropionase-like amidohydrolase